MEQKAAALAAKNTLGASLVAASTALGASLVAASTAPTAKPKIIKKPILGQLGDNGKLVVVKQPATDKKLHCQQAVILDVLASTKGQATRHDIVKKIEGDAKLLERMDTVQPVFRCVKYHERKLTQAGIIRVEKMEAPKPVATEAPATK